MSLDYRYLVWMHWEGYRGEGPTLIEEMGVYVAARPGLTGRRLGGGDELWHTAVLGNDLYVTSEDCVIWRYSILSGSAEQAFPLGGSCWPLVSDGDALVFGANWNGPVLLRVVPHPEDKNPGFLSPFAGLEGIVQSIAVDGHYVFYTVDLNMKSQVYRLTKRPGRLWRETSRPPDLVYEGGQSLSLASAPTHLFVSDRDRNAIVAINKSNWNVEVLATATAPSEVGAARGGAVWAENATGRIVHSDPLSRKITVLVENLTAPRLRAVDDDLLVWSTPSTTIQSGDDLYAMSWPDVATN